MPDSNRRALILGALALLVSVAGVLVPRSMSAAAPVAPARPATPVAPAAPGVPATTGGAPRGGTIFELVLFGDSLDGERLDSDAEPLLVYRVPAGAELCLTDVDATSGGFVLWRGARQELTQVGFIVDRAGIGLGQSSRSYATGIRFGPGDELLVGPAGSDVEWAALRGLLTPLGQPVAGR